MYNDQIFCFTPKGNLIILPKGANAIDFSYAVHSEIGNAAVGAKINNKNRLITTEIKNGDQKTTTATEIHDFAGKARVTHALRPSARTDPYDGLLDSP